VQRPYACSGRPQGCAPATNHYPPAVSTADLGAALALATADGAAPLDVVFFDQCFQGNLDVLYEVRNAAAVFVAYLHLGQPDELMGAGSFARILRA
jgi:hypothetical protein